MYMDGTWLQLMCCTHPDVLSLYFGRMDGQTGVRREGEKREELVFDMICDFICVDLCCDFRLKN